MDRFNFYKNRLEKRESQNRKRALKPYIPLKGGRVKKDGKILINLSSNDYLGLTFNREILNKGIEFAKEYGNGTGGSRLVTGSPKPYFDIEEKISKLKHKDKTILLNSGYQANLTMISALLGRKGIIFSDYLNHNSIVRGCLLSGAKLKRFEHNNYDNLEKLLSESIDQTYSSKIIVTESVFSMDGDVSDIDRLKDLALKYDSILVVDEAHSTGVLGDNGMGIAKKADIVMGTFGKGGGVFGAYISCNEIIYNYLVNFCEGLIFSTSFPPFIAGAISASIDIISKMDKEREYLKSISNRLRIGLNDLGYDTHTSSTQIIPVLTGSEEKALNLSKFLEERGLLGIAIRPPTVPDNMSRVRLSLLACHKEEDIEYILRVFNEYKKEI